MNVGQTLLNNAENGQFGVIWQPSKIGRDFQIDFNLAAFRKAVYVPAKSRGQTSDLEQPAGAFCFRAELYVPVGSLATSATCGTGSSFADAAFFPLPPRFT